MRMKGIRRIKGIRMGFNVLEFSKLKTAKEADEYIRLTYEPDAIWTTGNVF